LVANWLRRDSNSGMKIVLTLSTALTLTACLAQADQTNDVAPAKIGTADAIKHYDEEMIVTGTVAQVTVRPAIVFLNLDKPFPDSPFTAVIHPEYTNDFGDLSRLKGRSVEIQGKVTKYHDKPEITLESTNQLKVVGAAASTNAPAAKP
jgi:DNA/RNA endonuclease YhcR with UshA esterase domain